MRWGSPGSARPALGLHRMQLPRGASHAPKAARQASALAARRRPVTPAAAVAAWGARIRREPLRQLPAGSVQAPAQQSVCGKRRLCSAATGQGQEAHEVPAMGNQHRASASVPANLSAGTAAGAASGLAAGRTSTMRSQHTQARAGAAASADGALARACRRTSRCTALHCCACRRIVTCGAWGTDDVCVFVYPAGLVW